MRVLVLGAGGMLGHKVWQSLRGRPRTEAFATARAPYERYERLGLFDPDRFLGGIDAEQFATVERALADIAPDVVVNCIGVVKQLPGAQDPVTAIALNALFPHQLAGACSQVGARLVHISTDCVFNGYRGMYTEEDDPDAVDLYGRSKLLGEVTGQGSITLRTSMIGRELTGTHGLVEWFLAQNGSSVRGYRRAMFSGLPTITLANVIIDVIERHPELSGLYHVAADPIDKFSLLRLLAEAFHRDVVVEPCDDVVIDRSLDGNRFRGATGFAPEPWPQLVEHLADDPSPYPRWRAATAGSGSPVAAGGR